MASDRGMQSSNWRAKGPAGGPSDVFQTKREAYDDYRHPFRKPPTNLSTEPRREIAEGNKIYMGNLPYAAKKSDVENFFNQVGCPVDRIDISIDPFNGRNPSYCFVFLPDEATAQRAINELSGQDFLGRPLKIGPCVRKRDTGQQTRSLARKRWEEANTTNSGSKTALKEITDDTDPYHYMDAILEGRRIRIDGLPRPQSQHDSDLAIQDLLSDFEIESISKVMSPHRSRAPDPGNNYYVWVDLKMPEDVPRVIAALDGLMRFNDRLLVSKATTIPRQIRERQESATRFPIAK
ncbi:MAG: hypothetical protein M1821_002966 [Bathelium mastoideum]|nr:MAG: hypothetical protein M1821_002966 [Bathelium mastoideum]KAI9694392.1 MAG: hypothetical protein M1822_000008 [Bathelium mastoideum]